MEGVIVEREERSEVCVLGQDFINVIMYWLYMLEGTPWPPEHNTEIKVSLIAYHSDMLNDQILHNVSINIVAIALLLWQYILL